MADQSSAPDLSGLLGQFDPSMIQQFAAQFAPQQSDKDAARTASLLAAAAGVFGGHGLAQGLSGGLLGLSQYPQQVREQQQIRGQQLSQGLQLYQAMRQQAVMNAMLQGMAGQQPGAAGAAPAPQTQPGPDATFQTPGGASGAFQSALGSGPAPITLPTQIPAPASVAPPPPNKAAMRNLLAGLNAANVAGGGKDMSAALGFAFPNPIPLRPGAGALDPTTGNVTPNPAPPPGYYYDAPTNSFKPVAGGQQAIATAAATPAAVSLAMQPQTGIIPGTSQTGIVGSVLNSLFPSGNLPYGAPNPNGAAGTPPSQGTPTGAIAPVQTALSPEEQAHSAELAEFEKNINSAGTSASKQGATYAALQQALTPLAGKTGPTLPARAQAAALAQDVLPSGVGKFAADMLTGGNSEQVLPAVTMLDKLTTGLAGLQLKEGFGTREAAQIIEMVKSAYPNASQVPGAPEAILGYMQGIRKWAGDTQQAMATWKSAPAGAVQGFDAVKNAPPGSIDGFPEAWNAEHPASSYVPPLGILGAIKDKKDVSAPMLAWQQGDAGTASQAAQSAPILTAAGKGNATVQAILQAGPTPQQMAILRQKGYIQ